MPNQTESGKAWEYGLARRFCALSGVDMVVNRPRYQSQTSYDLLPEGERMAIDRAASESVVFLKAHDPRLNDAKLIAIQPDSAGRRGDVRDILVQTNSGETIGISAKHRHAALKHSRLSDKLDFGEDWYGKPCSKEYWDAVSPVFNALRASSATYWRELPNKWEDYYAPIMRAFINEVSRNADVERMLLYLAGRFDFYKVIKVNGNIRIQSFNLRGDLLWGSKVPLPNRVIEFDMRDNSRTTADLTLSRGWSLSFRIHNANALIEPSLKFDVQLTGNPNEMGNYEIPYG